MTTATTVLPATLGKYQVKREVGRGAMGIVYEGFDPVITRRVALKTLINPSFAGPEAAEQLNRLRREAQAAGRLNHPHIVGVYDFGEDCIKLEGGGESTVAFIAMEFIEGRELKSFFDGNERFPLPTVERILGELLDALQYSHVHGVVHRDIKPANIILLEDGSVKVADFGIARIETSTLTQVGTVMGSPSYMSPEQFAGQVVDPRSDLYSVGVVLYQMLTGDVPFTGSFYTIMHRVLNEDAPAPSLLNVHVNKAFDQVVRRALAKRPADRYQSANEFKDALIAANAAQTDARTGGHETVVNPSSAAVAAKRPGRVWLGVGALAACLLIGLVATYEWHASHGRTPTEASAVKAETGGAVPAAPTAVIPPPPSSSPGSVTVSAVGLAEPDDTGGPTPTTDIEQRVWADARRQLIEKAAALYVDSGSLDANYGLLRTKLLAHSDDFITAVVDRSVPQQSKYGLTLGTMRATVKVRDVQKSLNQISRESNVEFVRNNANPRIAVEITDLSADGLPAQRSAVAENILKERIKSFGFMIVDDAAANPPADFLVTGEVHFKRLSARLAASGLTIEKFVLTSWTVKAVDTVSGEEIYHNTAIPEKQSWASEELAMRDVGGMIGTEFSKNFFLQYVNFSAQKIRLRFLGLPMTARTSLVSEVNASERVLDSTPVESTGGDLVLAAQLSGSEAATALIDAAVVRPLNHKLGANCFAVTGSDELEIRIAFDAKCTSAMTMDRLDSSPPEAIMSAPAQRIQEVVKNPKLLQQLKI